MKKKINIGFIINFSHNRWLGGSNYFSNLFEGLDLHTNHSINIFTGIDKNKLNPNFKKYNIIYLSILNPNKKINIFINYLRFILLIFFKRDFIFEKILDKYKIDVLSHSYPLGKYSKIKSIYWIPDLQELHLKKNFSLKKRIRRWFDHKISIKNSSAILFSSKSVKDIFVSKYPQSSKKTSVLHFLNKLPIKKPHGKIYKRYKNYFLISNQFWIHKNYDVIIDALIELKKQKIELYIISTGTKYDWRSSSYYENLIRKIKLNKLSNFILLGKVSREEQLNLMLNAKSLINPSRSEGWNTAIEEAKSLKKNVIASNLKVHIEQLGSKSLYFKCEDYKKLAEILKKIVLNKKKTKIHKYKKLYKLNEYKFKKFALKYDYILNHV